MAATAHLVERRLEFGKPNDAASRVDELRTHNACPSQAVVSYRSTSNEPREIAMVIYVNTAARIPADSDRNALVLADAETDADAREPSHKPPLGRYVKSAGKWFWRQLVNAISGPGLEGGGIDEGAFPSGFAAPYKQGSRQVRNLWHEPF